MFFHSIVFWGTGMGKHLRFKRVYFFPILTLAVLFKAIFFIKPKLNQFCVVVFIS